MMRRLSGATDSLAVWTRATGRIADVPIPTTGKARNQQFSLDDVSSNGRFVVFDSLATNILAGDHNDSNDVFVLDRDTGSVSLGSASASGSVGSFPGADGGTISADGRSLAFDSASSDLVAGDTNGLSDVFVRDLQDSTTTRVSVSSDGVQGNKGPSTSASGPASGSGLPDISSDGRWVAFDSDSTNLVSNDTDGVRDVFLRDLVSGTTTRVSVPTDTTQADASSWGARVSGDGRYVTYTSDADDLVPNDTNGVTDVFMWDRLTGVTTRISVASNGAQANEAKTRMAGYQGAHVTALSDDGRYVTFDATASNLVRGDTNGSTDAFVHVMATGKTRRVSSTVYGTLPEETEYGSSASSMSADGRLAVFNTEARNIRTQPTTGDATYLWDRDGTPAPRTRPLQMRPPYVERQDAHHLRLYIFIAGDGGWPIDRFQARCKAADSSWRTSSRPNTLKAFRVPWVMRVHTGITHCQVRAHNHLGYGQWSKARLVR